MVESKPAASNRLSSSGRKDMAFCLHWAGITLLLYYITVMMYSALPLQLLNPAWIQKICIAFLTTSNSALLGAIFVSVSPFVDPDAPFIKRRTILIRRLASFAAIGFLFLIPVLTYSGVRLIEQKDNAQVQLIQMAKKATLGIEQATTYEQLRDAYAMIPGTKPVFPERFNVPIEQVRDRIIGQINQVVKSTETRLANDLSNLWKQWITELSSNIIRLLILFLGFAAIGRKSPHHPSLLRYLFDILSRDRTGKKRADTSRKESRLRRAASQ
jgi:hypothetical protein